MSLGQAELHSAFKASLNQSETPSQIKHRLGLSPWALSPPLWESSPLEQLSSEVTSWNVHMEWDPSCHVTPVSSRGTHAPPAKPLDKTTARPMAADISSRPGTERFPGLGTFSAKSRVLLGKLGQPVTLTIAIPSGVTWARDLQAAVLCSGSTQ